MFSRLAAVACFTLAIGGYVEASTITTYDVTGSLNDGGDTLTIAGTFDYDTSDNAVSNWDLAISGPFSAPFCGRLTDPLCYTFQPGTSASASFTPDLFKFIGPDTGGYTDTLDIVPGNSSSPLPNGTYTLNSSSALFTLSPGGASGEAAFITGTLSPETVATPEPGTLSIAAGAMLISIEWRRRRRGL